MESIIHVGFQKCASTFLQKHIFPKLKTYEYVDWQNDNEYAKLGSCFLEDISKTSPIFELPEKNVLISREGFVRANFPLQFYRYGHDRTKDILVANISKLFKDKGKILFVIRRQDEMVSSWIKFKGTFFMDSKKFFWDYPMKGKDLNDASLENRYGRYYTEYLDYFTIIQRFATVLGKERVHVLVFEDIANNRDKFYKDLSHAIGEDVTKYAKQSIPKENVSEQIETFPPMLSVHQQTISKIGKHVPNGFKSLMKKLLMKKRSNFYNEDREAILAIYKESNKRLSESFDLKLDRYDYY